MHSNFILADGTKFMFSVNEDLREVEVRLFKPKTYFSSGGFIYNLKDGVLVSQIIRLVDHLDVPEPAANDLIAKLTQRAETLLTTGVIEEVASGFDFVDEKILLYHVNETGTFCASVVVCDTTAGVCTFEKQGSDQKLGLTHKSAQHLIAALSRDYQKSDRITQIKQLREQAEKFVERVQALMETDEPAESLQEQLESITFDYAHSQAEVYVGEIKQDLYILGERHVYTAKVTAVKVNGEWKKLHYALPDRTFKSEARTYLNDTLGSLLTRMVDNDELELLV